MAKDNTPKVCNQIAKFKVRYLDENGKLKFDGQDALDKKTAKARLAELVKQHKAEKRKCTDYKVKKIYVGGHIKEAVKQEKTENKPSKKEGSDK